MQTVPPATPAAPGPPAPRPWAAWLQFPRRAVLLLVAYALCAGLLLALRGPLSGGAVSDWSASAATGQPVAEIFGERVSVTLPLLAAALVLALPLAALGALLSAG